MRSDMALSLAIVTPTEEALRLDCSEVVAPGTTGELGILPGHVPLVTTLTAGALTVVSEGQRSVYAVGPGYAEVDEDHVTVLTEACLAPKAIDLEEARRDLSSAEARMRDGGPNDPAFVEAARDAAWRAPHRRGLATLSRDSSGRPLPTEPA
ncbi:MAG: ATP synthase F1 subunit epsilon [Myxococcales bacterium]|nr:ATP synthase F1 subunit epsilon [Myxococcales bacterium]